MTQTDDILGEQFRAPADDAYMDLGSDIADRRDGQVYVHDPPLRLAVRVAIATRRPLLLRGPAGSGKSSLAPFVARMYTRRFYKATITARTEARDLMWSFDALKRLNDAQVLRDPSHPEAARVHRIEHYIEPRALWWAFNDRTASRRGVPDDDPVKVDLVTDPGVGHRANGVVVLIDEIDKADPDVPNNLLEALGSLQFTVAETGHEVKATEAPLVIITTNDERELPAAFYRRCIVHTLPEHKKTRLVEIAGQHFGGLEPADDPGIRTLYEAVADQIERYRTDKKERKPSTAEYLDAVRACLDLGIDTDHQDWADVARLTLTKRAPDTTA